MLADAHISSLVYLWRLFNETQQNFFLFVLFPVHEVHYPFRDLLVYPGAPGLSHHATTSIIVIKRHSASPGGLLASHIMKNACRACVIAAWILRLGAPLVARNYLTIKNPPPPPPQLILAAATTNIKNIISALNYNKDNAGVQSENSGKGGRRLADSIGLFTELALKEV